MAIGIQIFAVAAGNALRLVVTPPDGPVWWRVLRRTADAFTGAGDTGAVVVADYCTDNAVLDTQALSNGTAYFYHAYFTADGVNFTDAPSVSAVPAPSYSDEAADPQLVLVERLAAGMAVEISAGRFEPASGTCPVVTSPYVLADKISFPMISVHLDSVGPEVRGIGEAVFGGIGGLGVPSDTDGWLSSYNLNAVGVSLNPDERISLRRAMRRVVQANLEIFDAAGMVNIGFAQQDSEDFDANAAPMFMTAGRFTCTAPTSIVYQRPPTADVSSTATVGTDQIHG